MGDYCARRRKPPIQGAPFTCMPSPLPLQTLQLSNEEVGLQLDNFAEDAGVKYSANQAMYSFGVSA